MIATEAARERLQNPLPAESLSKERIAYLETLVGQAKTAAAIFTQFTQELREAAEARSPQKKKKNVPAKTRAVSKLAPEPAGTVRISIPRYSPPPAVRPAQAALPPMKRTEYQHS